MKITILPLLLLLSTTYALAATKLNLDISYADYGQAKIVMPLKQGEVASILKENQQKTGPRLTATILNQKEDSYEIEVKIEKENEIINRSVVAIKKGEDLLLQSFNSQGVDQFKLLIKADR